MHSKYNRLTFVMIFGGFPVCQRWTLNKYEIHVSEAPHLSPQNDEMTSVLDIVACLLSVEYLNCLFYSQINLYSCSYIWLWIRMFLKCHAFMGNYNWQDFHWSILSFIMAFENKRICSGHIDLRISLLTENSTPGKGLLRKLFRAYITASYGNCFHEFRFDS